MYKRIALIKTAWSENYDGELPIGRHANVRKHREGYERFNFRRTSSGRYYGYLPPIGPGESAPRAPAQGGWLLVFVAARNGNGPLVVVGWYENATILSEYLGRPEYVDEGVFERDVYGNPYTYCLSIASAHLVYPEDRTNKISGEHIRRTPIVYIRGGKRDDAWRESLARKVESFVRHHSSASKRTSFPLQFPDGEHRRKVERASVKAVREMLNKTHRIKSRESEKCGYDLLAVHRSRESEWHVEVKGTASSEMHFVMTRNEKNYMRDERWRLAIVTLALERPRVKILRARKVLELFDIEPIAWEGVVRG